MLRDDSGRRDVFHMYVEKFYNASHEVVLDFVTDEEFEIFQREILKNYGDYVCADNSLIMLKEYKETIYGKPVEGAVYSIPYAFFHGKEIRGSTYAYDDVLCCLNCRQDEEECDKEYSKVFTRDSRLKRVNDKELDRLQVESVNTFCKNLTSVTPKIGLSASADFKVDIKAVGNGNWNIIYEDDTPVLFFDMGKGIKYKNDDFFPKGINRSQYLLSEVAGNHIGIVISHWDSDHYNLLKNIEDDDLERLFRYAYVPDVELQIDKCKSRIIDNEVVYYYPETSRTCQKIFLRLCNHCKDGVKVVRALKKSRGQENELDIRESGDNWILFCGKKEAEHERNKSGLFLALINSAHRILLLTADHSWLQVYKCLSDGITDFLKEKNDFFDYCRYLVDMTIPHHGANTEEPGFALSDKVHKNFIFNTGVFPVGKNGYNHPRCRNVGNIPCSRFSNLLSTSLNGNVVLPINSAIIYGFFDKSRCSSCCLKYGTNSPNKRCNKLLDSKDR